MANFITKKSISEIFTTTVQSIKIREGHNSTLWFCTIVCVAVFIISCMNSSFLLQGDVAPVFNKLLPANMWPVISIISAIFTLVSINELKKSIKKINNKSLARLLYLNAKIEINNIPGITDCLEYINHINELYTESIHRNDTQDTAAAFKLAFQLSLTIEELVKYKIKQIDELAAIKNVIVHADGLNNASKLLHEASKGYNEELAKFKFLFTSFKTAENPVVVKVVKLKSGGTYCGA